MALTEEQFERALRGAQSVQESEIFVQEVRKLQSDYQNLLKLYREKSDIVRDLEKMNQRFKEVLVQCAIPLEVIGGSNLMSSDGYLSPWLKDHILRDIESIRLVVGKIT
jgi:hypothetical protein